MKAVTWSDKILLSGSICDLAVDKAVTIMRFALQPGVAVVY